MRQETEPGRPQQPPALEAARRGDPGAFDQVVRPLLGSLLALARRLAGEAAGEDLLQEGLLRAWRGLAGFREETTFRAWVAGILFRLSREPRRFRPRPERAAAARAIPDRLDPDPLLKASARELLDRVEQALERLPAPQRTALHLRAIEGWGYAEIAAALETSAGAARTAVFAARRRLRARMGDLL